MDGEDWCFRETDSGVTMNDKVGNAVVGLGFEDASKVAETMGMHVVKVEEDGQYYVITANLDLKRVKVAVRNGVVVRMVGIG